MKKLLLFAGVVTFAVTAAFAYFIEPPPLPLFDANRQLLAESYVEGYCSGQVMMTRTPVESCWADNPDLATHRNLSQVVTAFCFGIVDAGWTGSSAECKQIMEDKQYWPLLHGGITSTWSSRYPYPTDRFAENVQPDESRTGIREGEER